MSEPRRRLLACTIIAFAALVGCGTGSGETQSGDAPPSSSSASPDSSEYATAIEAKEAKSGERLRLKADLVIDEEGIARVCHGVQESSPPSCEKHSAVVLSGIEDPEALDLEHLRGVYWGSIEAVVAKRDDRLELVELISVDS